MDYKHAHKRRPTDRETIWIIVLILIVLVVGFALPNFRTARTTSSVNECINNLRQIDGAKWSWHLEQAKSTNAVATWDDITPYLKAKPICPEGGVYSINAVWKRSTCSVGRSVRPFHVLPE